MTKKKKSKKQIKTTKEDIFFNCSNCNKSYVVHFSGIGSIIPCIRCSCKILVPFQDVFLDKVPFGYALTYEPSTRLLFKNKVLYQWWPSSFNAILKGLWIKVSQV